MDDAVVLSACRTPIGSFGGVFKDLSAADLGAVVIREAIARAGVEAGRHRRRDHGLRAAGRRRHERRAPGRAQGRRAGRSARRKRSIASADPGCRPSCTPSKRCRPASSTCPGRRHRVDEQRAVPAEGRALGLSDGQRRGHRLDAARRPHLRDQRLPHGRSRPRRSPSATASRAPTRTPSPPRASAARPRR